jgi:hypothetical protein
MVVKNKKIGGDKAKRYDGVQKNMFVCLVVKFIYDNFQRKTSNSLLASHVCGYFSLLEINNFYIIIKRMFDSE